MLWLFPGENSEDATRKGFVTSLLIWVNVLVYILCLLTWLDLQPDGFPNEEELYLKFGYIPGKYNPVTHVTSMFLHAGWFHLLCNMFVLWGFGNRLENRLGATYFLFLYFVGGIFGDLLYMVFNKESLLPCVGASASISAVIGAYYVFFPDRRLHIFVYFGLYKITEVPVSAYILIPLWFLLDFYEAFTVHSGLFPEATSEIAVTAHIGGLLFGLLSASLIQIAQRE